MATETEPRHADDAGVEVDVAVPDDVTPGKPAIVRIRVTDAATGRPVDNIGRSHEAWMHFIVTRDDLGTFAHIHPKPSGRPGEFTTRLTFPTVGRYLVHTEFRRQGEMSDLVARDEIVVGDPTRLSRQAATPSSREQVVDGIRVSLEGDAEVGTESRFTYRFTDAATGAPIDTLQPYLAAAGHVVIMPVDGSGFAHEHAEVEDDRGRPVFALPGQRFGPELDLHADFPRPGLYRLWGQFRDADGRVLTTTFTVEAHDEANTTTRR